MLGDLIDAIAAVQNIDDTIDEVICAIYYPNNTQLAFKKASDVLFEAVGKFSTVNYMPTKFRLIFTY